MNIKTLLLSFLAMAALSGCYTRLGSIEQPLEQLNISDTLQDSAVGSAKVDTIIYKEKEICIWERDFTGMPRLRCFPSYYPRDWYFYSSSPWWFRNSAYWYDYKRCPRYYYFDPHCGCCKYTRFYPYKHGTGGGGGSHGSTVSGGIPNRSRSVGNTGSSSVRRGGTTLPKSSQNNVEQRGVSNPNNSGAPNRNRDVGQLGGSRVNQSPNQVGGAVQKKVEAVQEPKNAAVVEQHDRPQRTDSSAIVPRTSPKRNSRW